MRGVRRHNCNTHIHTHAECSVGLQSDSGSEYDKLGVGLFDAGVQLEKRRKTGQTCLAGFLCVCVCVLRTTRVMSNRGFSGSWLLRKMQKKQEMLSDSGSVLYIIPRVHKVSDTITHTYTTAHIHLYIHL